MILEKLINYPESDWLDFKQEWYNSTADMILDILCMANSDANSNRYIVIGYDEKNKQFHDIQQNRKNSDDFHNILNTSNFNRIPNTYIKSIKIDNNLLDIIVIEKTNYRPFFLLKDKSKNGRIVRAGVIYSRNGSSNTPICDTTSESQIADMWRERFGLNLTPKERFKSYVEDYDNWTHIYEEDGKNIWYYNKFPEFSIQFVEPEKMVKYSNPIEHSPEIFTHSIANSYETNIYYKYHNTTLEREKLYICDGMRFLLLHPHADYLYYANNDIEDIHVFPQSSKLSDRGKTIEEIDARTYKRIGKHNQVVFYYNFKNSFKYYIQQIINPKNSNIYDEYRYFDESNLKDGENENIVCPSQIYLLEENADISKKLREEFLKIQRN